MEWWQWVVTLSGVAVGIRVLWLIIEEVVDARRAYPVLMEIAEQFKPNGGSSLHDRINALTEMQESQSSVLAEQGILLDNISQQLENKLT